MAIFGKPFCDWAHKLVLVDNKDRGYDKDEMLWFGRGMLSIMLLQENKRCPYCGRCIRNVCCNHCQDGVDGEPGRDGIDGAPGSQDPIGPQGEQGPAGPQGEQELPGGAGMNYASYVNANTTMVPIGTSAGYDTTLVQNGFSMSADHRVVTALNSMNAVMLDFGVSSITSGTVLTLYVNGVATSYTASSVSGQVSISLIYPNPVPAGTTFEWRVSNPLPGSPGGTTLNPLIYSNGAYFRLVQLA